MQEEAGAVQVAEAVPGPVSGVVHAEVVDREINLSALLSMVQHSGIGAVSLFVGTVRDVNEGREVSGMEYDAYVPMAKASQLSAIALEGVCETRTGACGGGRTP